MGYTRKALENLTYLGLLRIGSKAIVFVKIIIVARILGPSEYGLFAITAVFLAFIEIITETGINAFLIQTKSIKEYINTAWVVSIARGVIITVLMVIFSYPVALFFSQSQSVNLLLLVSIVPLVRGFINPSIVKFQKDLQFRKLLIFNGTLTIIESIVAILLTIITNSAIGLIYAMILAAIIEVVLSLLFIKPYPRFIFESKKFIKVLQRGKWITLTGIFNYIVMQGDDIVVGKMLGSGSLGIYQVAYKISTLPVKEIGGAFGSVTFPIYTHIRSDKKRLKRALIKVLFFTSLILIPFSIGIIVASPLIVEYTLGNQWQQAVPIMRYLAIFGIIRAYTGLLSALLLSVERQENITSITFVGTAILLITIFPFINIFGLHGAAYAVVLASIVELPVAVWYVKKVF